MKKLLLVVFLFLVPWTFWSLQSNFAKKDPLYEIARKRFPEIYHKYNNEKKIIVDQKLKKHYQIKAMTRVLVTEQMERDPSFVLKIRKKLLRQNPVVLTLAQEQVTGRYSSNILLLNTDPCREYLSRTKIAVDELKRVCVDDYLNPGGWDRGQFIQVSVQAFDGLHNDPDVQKDWSQAMNKAAEKLAIQSFLAKKGSSAHL